MPHSIALDNFSGPLDLLLKLIEEKEMDITTVSLSAVAEQFLSYLEQIEERRPDELADFLVIATRLLLLKSYALLPYLYTQEEEDPRELEAQLRMYKKYADATALIQTAWEKSTTLYEKKALPVDIAFRPPHDMTTQKMREFFIETLARLEPVVRIPKAAYQKVMSLREKLAQIHDVIEKNVMMHFSELVSSAEDRGDMVITFLAILELVKQQSVVVKQTGSFSDIIIEKASV
ncbi:MAG: segregation/condensation protein A [Candidatus Kerfeldbacteria bacterium]|nr:segregation/condensation protein A [Candidatus Kerfeldbacteria bacterium]